MATFREIKSSLRTPLAMYKTPSHLCQVNTVSSKHKSWRNNQFPIKYSTYKVDLIQTKYMNINMRRFL